MSRFLLFALTGVLFFVNWAVARPSFEMTASMTEWPHVLWFSATLLSLAVALVVFGRMVGGRWVVRLASIAGAGPGLSSVANVFEDGFRIEAFFFAFILGSLILDVALLALTMVIARTFPGRYRLLALIPAGTVAGIFLFVVAGGPILLVTWLAAAAVAALRSRQAAMLGAPATPLTGRPLSTRVRPRPAGLRHYSIRDWSRYWSPRPRVRGARRRVTGVSNGQTYSDDRRDLHSGEERCSQPPNPPAS